MIIGLAVGIVAFLFVWMLHHRMRERLVAWFVLRDRSLAWQVRERIIVSIICGISAAFVAGCLAAFFSSPVEYEYVDDSDLYYSEEGTVPDDAMREDFAHDGGRESGDTARDTTGMPDDFLADETAELKGADLRARRPLILAKRNFSMTLKGSIDGEWPVIMELQSKDRVLSGTYYDDGRLIDARLKGEVQRDGDCVIHGYMAGDSLVDIFSGVFNNRSFVGVREDPNSSETQPMKLVAVKKKPILRSLFRRK